MESASQGHEGLGVPSCIQELANYLYARPYCLVSYFSFSLKQMLYILFLILNIVTLFKLC